MHIKLSNDTNAIRVDSRFITWYGGTWFDFDVPAQEGYATSGFYNLVFHHAADSQVTVPAGNFSCYYTGYSHVNFSTNGDQNMSSSLFFANNKGLVRYTTYYHQVTGVWGSSNRGYAQTNSEFRLVSCSLH